MPTTITPRRSRQAAIHFLGKRSMVSPMHRVSRFAASDGTRLPPPVAPSWEEGTKTRRGPFHRGAPLAGSPALSGAAPGQPHRVARICPPGRVCVSQAGGMSSTPQVAMVMSYGAPSGCPSRPSPTTSSGKCPAVPSAVRARAQTSGVHLDGGVARVAVRRVAGPSSVRRASGTRRAAARGWR
jgi:hypothetical protein